jgi:hypothetical protein
MLWGLTLEVVRMAHQCRRPIVNGCMVGSKLTIGLIRGETLWVGASSSGDPVMDGGGRARVRQHSGVVGVARGGIRSRSQSHLLFINCSHSRVHSFKSFSAHAFIKGGSVYVFQLLGRRDNKREDAASQCMMQHGNP